MDDTSDIFASPSKTPTGDPPSERPKTPVNQTSRYDAEEIREAALRRELEGVRNINEVIGGVLTTLEKAKGNMGTVSQTVDNASSLLSTWTRILSQTEHNQRLILNPNWQGATQDVLDLENEALHKQQEAERRAAEAERRREETRRRVEEEERLRLAGGSSSTRGAGRGARGRGRGLGRAASSGRGRGATPGAGSAASNFTGTRRGSGIGRGASGSVNTRAGAGRGRGTTQ